MDYAATALLRSAADDKKIIEQVKQIKGSKFSESELNKELGILKNINILTDKHKTPAVGKPEFCV